MEASPGMVKVRFELEPGNIGASDTETVWATPVGPGEYRIENVPFYARVRFGDVVEAEPAGGVFDFRGVIRRGGHSTYTIYAQSGRSDPAVASVIESLVAIRCDIETATQKLIAVDVPPGVDIHRVYRELEQAATRGVIDFQESHCGHPDCADTPPTEQPA